MSKKIIVALIVAILSFTAIFTACNKDNYTDPSSGDKYILVTDENGEKVLSPDGELLVYVTDEDGKKIKDKEGNFETEVHGFVGQIENNGVVEDYAYYFTLPSGWKAVNDRGEFENKSQKSNLQIEILDITFTDARAKINSVHKVLTEQSAEGGIDAIIKNSYDNEKVGGKVYTLCVKYNDNIDATIIFENNGNSYQLNFETTRDITVEEAEAEVIELINSLKFKPYAYYNDLTNAPTTAVAIED